MKKVFIITIVLLIIICCSYLIYTNTDKITNKVSAQVIEPVIPNGGPKVRKDCFFQNQKIYVCLSENANACTDTNCAETN